MLETMVERQVIFYVIGAVMAAGIAAKLVVGISLKRLVKATSNMGKSNHAFIRLVRAKFEHACMVSDKVQNVRAFVEKYLYEYKTMGIRLHSWQHFEKLSGWMCVLLAAVGAGLAYYKKGSGSAVYQYGIVGGVGAMFLLLLRVMSDEQYQMEAAKTYMVDFLENTYAHRYVKSSQKEFQVKVQQVPPEKAEPEIPETVAVNAEVTAEKTEEIPYFEPQIREVPPVSDPMVYPGRVPEKEPEPAHSPQTPTKTEPEIPKEARIREILEEFLA